MNGLPKLIAIIAICCLVFPHVTQGAEERTGRDPARTRSLAARDGAGDEPQEPGALHPLVQRFTDRQRMSDSALANRAAGLLARAAREDGDDAIMSLTRVLGLGLDAGDGHDKLLAEVYERLGNLYAGTPDKQLDFYAAALQITPRPADRARLRQRIEDLGGDVFALAALPRGPVGSPRDSGPDDSCDGAVPVTLDHSEVMSIQPSGDHNWRSFDVPGPNAWSVRIETISDEPPFIDDTDLTLWTGCENGTPGVMQAFDDDGGEGFMSLLEIDCLPPGAYYVQVGGYFDLLTPDNFTLEIAVTDSCVLPSPDGYEPDDDRAAAAAIGLPTSLPAHANGWGRAKKEIQGRSIFPGGDVDFASFRITGNELVRVATAGEFPTVFNGFHASEPQDNPDTYVELHYGTEPRYLGGWCNDFSSGSLTHECMTDEDCEGLIVVPLPGLPDCIPWYLAALCDPEPCPVPGPLAHNEDRNPGGDLGSELAICLPRGDGQTTSASAGGDWLVRVSSSPYDPAAIFDYELQVKNEVVCDFEVEPNQDFAQANPLEPGDTVHGIYDKSAHAYYEADADLYSFDVDGLAAVWFETDGYDSYAVDTALELYVGPDDAGDYFFAGDMNDDGGPGWLSRLELVLIPANELLENTVADADYYLNVTSWWLNFNYPYTLRSGETTLWGHEAEPNDAAGLANPVGPGDTVTGSIAPACDFDSFTLTLDEPGYVVVATSGSGDTALQLETAQGDRLACDDDGGPSFGSTIQGCLPAGDYIVRLRAYSGYSTLDYQLSVEAAPGCLPTAPPSLLADGLYRCDDYPGGEFDTCPN